jgi:hypothetical protein
VSSQQAAQIHIAPFADATQVTTAAGRRLARGEGEPTGELPVATKRTDVIDRADKGRRRQDADAGYLLQATRNGMFASDLREFLINGGDPGSGTRAVASRGCVSRIAAQRRLATDGGGRILSHRC